MAFLAFTSFEFLLCREHFLSVNALKDMNLDLSHGLLMLDVCCNGFWRARISDYLVERAKKCLEFCETIYIIHLFICLFYEGWPSAMAWWVVNISGFAVMALLGEYFGMRREL
ncbi:hypothetical protein ACS0TY_000710 [Phlomoides rotata]